MLLARSTWHNQIIHLDKALDNRPSLVIAFDPQCAVTSATNHIQFPTMLRIRVLVQASAATYLRRFLLPDSRPCYLPSLLVI